MSICFINNLQVANNTFYGITSRKFSIFIKPGTIFLSIILLGLFIAIIFLILNVEADSRTSSESSKKLFFHCQIE